VQVRIFLLLLVMLMRVVSGRFRPIRAGFTTGTRKRGWLRKAFFSRVRRMSYHEKIASTNSEISFEASFWL
jgi:hypothetical protein